MSGYLTHAGQEYQHLFLLKVSKIWISFIKEVNEEELPDRIDVSMYSYAADTTRPCL